MTPEEKLLALIQQDKKPAGAGGQQAVAGSAVPAVAEPQVPSVGSVQVKEPSPRKGEGGAFHTSVAEVPPEKAEKKLKLASAPVEKLDGTVVPAVVATESAGGAPAAKTADSPGYRKSVQRPGSLNGLVLFNRVLAGVVLVLLGVVVYSVASIRADVAAEGDRLKAGAGTHHVAVVALVKEELPSVDVFLDKVSQRNVFLSVEAKTATSTVAALTGKVADLKLLGVSIDSAVDQESMAIIRNKAESRTYFVKKGQLVGDTGYTLERVLSDRAVLKQGKQEIELK